MRLRCALVPLCGISSLNTPPRIGCRRPLSICSARCFAAPVSSRSMCACVRVCVCAYVYVYVYVYVCVYVCMYDCHIAVAF